LRRKENRLEAVEGAERLTVDQPCQRRAAAIRLEQDGLLPGVGRRDEHGRPVGGKGDRGRRQRRLADRRCRLARACEDLEIGRQFLRRAHEDGARRRRGRCAPVIGQEFECPEQDGSGRLAANASGARSAIGPPDPDADGIVVGEADRPGIAEAVGGAGLEAQRALAGQPLAHRPAFRKCDTVQDVAQIPGSHRTEQAMALARRCGFERAQRPHRAAFRNARIEHGDIGETDAETAQRDRQARRGVSCGIGKPRACVFERQRKTQGPDPVEHGHRRHVERHAQGFRRRHRTLERTFEVARRIIAERHRLVFHAARGMKDKIVEGEAVDERLECGAGRARAHRQIDLPRSPPIIRAADIGEHIARPVFDDDDGEAAAVLQIGALSGCHPLY